MNESILLITNKIESSQKHICNLLSNAANEQQHKNTTKTRTFDSKDDLFKVISDNETYKSFDFKKFTPSIIFVVPELLWENDAINEGYNIARELITHTYNAEFIQLVFLSVIDRSTLSKTVDTRNRSFVEAFPHVCLLDNEPEIRFEYYSNIHFNLIKHLAISDHGRLQKIGHEMNSVNANILNEKLEIQQNKTQLLKELEELSLFQSWIPTGTNIQELIAVVNNATQKSELEKIGKDISSIISDISLKLPKDGSEKAIEKAHKKEYKVLVIEDEANYREDFYRVLSNFYKDVYPDQKNKYLSGNDYKEFNILDAREIIAKNAESYQIFLLDLLYKDQDGNWLNFNGLDLFKLIIEKNRYAVIRIITSLPRGIVAKVVESIFNNTSKPNTDQVFTKKYGYEALKDSIIDSIDKINEECFENSRSKSKMSPFPKVGLFKWPGIPNLMYELMFVRKTEYNDCLAKSQDHFKNFVEGKLSRDSIDWNSGKLPKPDKKKNVDETYFITKLSIVLTHRRIALQSALFNNDFSILYDDYFKKIEPITNITDTIDKGYFQTKLGFNGTELKDNGNSYGFKVALTNLFPEELKFITSSLLEKDNEIGNKLLRILNSDLDIFFKKILSELVTYENWEVLHLNFDPYQDQRSSIDKGNFMSMDSFPDLSVKQLILFLQSLIDHYDEDFIESIATIVTDNAPGGNKIKNQSIEVLINNLYNK